MYEEHKDPAKYFSPASRVLCNGLSCYESCRSIISRVFGSAAALLLNQPLCQTLHYAKRVLCALV